MLDLKILVSEYLDCPNKEHSFNYKRWRLDGYGFDDSFSVFEDGDLVFTVLAGRVVTSNSDEVLKELDELLHFRVVLEEKCTLNGAQNQYVTVQKDCEKITVRLHRGIKHSQIVDLMNCLDCSKEIVCLLV